MGIDDVLMTSGGEFHAEEPATENERFPSFELDLGKTMRLLCVWAREYYNHSNS